MSKTQGYGRNPFYKPYKDHDFPTFKGTVEEYGAWKREWQNNVLPWMDADVALREMNRCTPKSIDLSIYVKVEAAWRCLERKYGNPLLVSSTMLDSFLELQPEDVEGSNEEMQLASLENILLRLTKQLTEVGEIHQLVENPAAIKKMGQLLPRSYGRVWSSCPEAKEATREVAGVADKRDMAKAHYDALFEFIESTVDNLHTQSPWLLQPQKSAKGNKSGSMKPGKTTYTNAFTGNRETDSGGDGADKAQKRLKEKQEQYGPCPACGKGHTFKGRTDAQIASSRMDTCKKFLAKTPDQMVDFVLEKDACTRCLSWVHVRADCPYDKMKCPVKHNDTLCGRPHHKLLHKSKRPAIVNLARTSIPDGDDILAPIVEVIIGGKKLIAMLDSGSNTSIIRHDAAASVHARAKFVRERVKLAGKPEEIQDTCLYTIPWTINGKQRTLRALGMCEVTDTYGPEDIAKAYELFPQYSPPELDRPQGTKVDLIIGLDNNDLLASGGQGDDQVGNLKVMSTPLSTGRVLTGHHPDIRGRGPQFSASAVASRKAMFVDSHDLAQPGRRSINAVRCHAVASSLLETEPGILEMEAEPEGEFLASEQIGVMIPKTCGKCQTCLQCVIQEDGPSVKEHLELDMMRKGMVHDPVNKRMVVSYPVVGDKSGYVNNYSQALSRAKTLWTSLEKRGLLSLYQENIQDYKQRGVWKPTDWDEIDDWKASGGLVHFCAHNAVLNEASLSTKVRIVVDSAIRNPGNNLSINDLWAAGPSTLNPLFDTLISFRSYEVGVVYDLSKAFHQIWTGKPEFFARLCVWRMTKDEPWSVFGTDVVGMGDRPATPMLDLTLTKAAKMSWHVDAKAAEQLARKRYADDTLGGGTREEAERMRGNITKVHKEDGSVTISTDGTISRILEPVSFKPKVVVLSGDKDPDLLAKIDRVLGVKWLPETDVLEYKFDVNLAMKVKGKRIKGPKLTLKDVEMVRSHNFSRRQALGICHQLYDPYGLTASYIMKLKVRLRELVLMELDWDETIPYVENEWWQHRVAEIIGAKSITFPRSVWVEKAKGRPELLGFWDGSDVGYGCLVFVRWLTSEPEQPETYYTTLMSSKAKVTPKICTTPRAELAGLVLLARLLRKIVPNMDKKPARLSLMGDSTCTIASLQMNVTGMKPFFANRVLEVITHLRHMGKEADRDITEELTLEERNDNKADLMVDLVHHIAGVDNPADTPSRGNIAWADMDRGSSYQSGPEFISKPRPTWADWLTRDFVKSLPPEETKKQFHNVMMLKTEDITHPGFKRLLQILDYSDDLKKIKHPCPRNHISQRSRYMENSNTGCLGKV